MGQYYKSSRPQYTAMFSPYTTKLAPASIWGHHYKSSRSQYTAMFSPYTTKLAPASTWGIITNHRAVSLQISLNAIAIPVYRHVLSVHHQTSPSLNMGQYYKSSRSQYTAMFSPYTTKLAPASTWGSITNHRDPSIPPCSLRTPPN